MITSAYLFLILSILIGVTGQILLKQGMLRQSSFQLKDIPTLIHNFPIVGGFACYGLSVLIYLKVLEQLPLSFAYPTVSLGYVLVIVFSKIFFGEPVSTSRWAAVVTICIGVVIVGLN